MTYFICFWSSDIFSSNMNRTISMKLVYNKLKRIVSVYLCMYTKSSKYILKKKYNSSPQIEHNVKLEKIVKVNRWISPQHISWILQISTLGKSIVINSHE